MKKLIYLFLGVFALLYNTQLKASHVVGSDMSYTCTTTPNVYKVTLKIYRDCSGINLCKNCGDNPVPTGNTNGCNTSNAGFSTNIIGMSGTCAGVNFGSYTLDALTTNNGYDIIQTCNNTKTVCTNCNTRTAGTFSPGIEVYIFEGLVDLSSVPASCCVVGLELSLCCRNTALTTMEPGNFYTNAQINRCVSVCNSAPTFSNEAVIMACVGVDYEYNLGAMDPDGDSLSYNLGASLATAGANVNYIAPYSPAYPFPYFGAPNANAPLPAGLHIDPNTGNLFFRPTGVFVANLVIEVKQWRNIAGTMTQVGLTRRDVQLQSVMCNPNLAPKIKIYQNGVLQSNNQFSVRPNQQICLDIVAEDQENSSIPADTTILTWNNPGLYVSAMGNATFTSNYIASLRSINGPKADSFKFCWTPPTTAVRPQPYLFSVTGNDNFCPFKSLSIKGINIKVENPLGVKAIAAENDLMVYPNPSQSWVTLTHKTNLAGKKYVVLSVDGQQVLNGKMNAFETMINIESLANGVYLIEIEGANTKGLKLIKN
ncbi:MAG: T9SS type A sorting domain-containing protein [Bacteroidota bacterium]